MDRMKYRDKSRAYQGILYGAFTLSAVFILYFVLYNPYQSTQIQYIRTTLKIATYSDLLDCQKLLRNFNATSDVKSAVATEDLQSISLSQVSIDTKSTQSNAFPTPIAKLGKAKSPRETFEATIKSCLGSYCKTEMFEEEGKKINRIGILLPDNSLSWEGLISSIKSLDPNEASIKIIQSSHVPPYGYGRNHGWTKIVRIVDRVPHQAYRFIVNSSSLTHQYDSLKLMYEIQVTYVLSLKVMSNFIVSSTL